MLEVVKNCLICEGQKYDGIRPCIKQLHILSNTASCAGRLGSDLILDAYCRDSFARLAPKVGSCASMYQLSTEVITAPSQSLRPWLYRIQRLQVRHTTERDTWIYLFVFYYMTSLNARP